MSHPDPAAKPDLRPWSVGDVLENPVTGETATILELPGQNPDRRIKAELIAVAGAKLVGEHLHPGMMERFTVLDGELNVRLGGKTTVLHQGETSEAPAGEWHDWWNASDRDARVVVEITPGGRFDHLIETMYGLARLGYVNEKGMPNPLQLAMIGREFSDTIEFRSPPRVVQKAMFGVLAPIAHVLGYRGTYPELSRSIAPRDKALKS